ncbi:MAG: asparagine synthase (glutamine-hydrolyzing) [Polyangiales bacterium]
MCGIAGIFHYADPERAVDRATLTRMTRAIAHRGPDSEGFFYDGALGLGHRRLAIVDLSPTGAQPMSTADGSHWIAYNGEYYNHKVARDSLSAKGISFRGSSDTETLLHLLATRGVDALADVAGIFGLAFWERDARRLTLARDPVGVKQVYYHDDGQRIVFASEIKALLECADVPREVDPSAVNEYLHVHTPLFDRTFLRDVKQLRAGEFLRVSGGGSTLRRYWEVTDFTPRGGSPEENVKDLRDELQHVVSEQLMSDVPVGSFFSGGIDSTAVASMAARAGLRPRCFGVHFSGQGVIDERPYQEAAAKALGLDLELITLDGGAFADDMERLLYVQDQPVIGAAMLPMFAVAGLAAKKVKVCVGGQAADEVFGGYARYALAHPLKVASQWLRGAPHALAQRLQRRGAPRAGTSGAPAARVGGNVWKQFAEPATLLRIARNLRAGVDGVTDWRERYFGNFAKVPERTWKDILTGEGMVSRDAVRDVFREVVDRSPATDPADKVMHWDAQTYLTGLFQQDDRMSMAHSLESRVPLADPRVVRFAFRSGFDLKFRDGASKWLLRQAVADVIPAEVLNRRKVGFDTPAVRWMQGPHKAWVREVLTSSTAKSRGFWDVRALERWLDRPGDSLWFDVVWKALCIELWARNTLDGRWRRFSTAEAPPPAISTTLSTER